MPSDESADPIQMRIFAVVGEFLSVVPKPKWLRVPLSLWVADRNAVVGASAARIHNFLVGWLPWRLRAGIRPGRWRGRVAQGDRGCHAQAIRWVRTVPNLLMPNEVLADVAHAFPGHLVALRTEIHRDGRVDVVVAIANTGTERPWRSRSVVSRLLRRAWSTTRCGCRGISRHRVWRV